MMCIDLLDRLSLEHMEIKAEEQPKISVIIRKRPLNRKELQRNDTDVIAVKNGEAVIVSEYKQKVDLTKYIEESIFNFDFAFDQTMNNQQIYNKAVRPLVESAFLGAKVTCFAYGQTGSGKTYTMNGDLDNGVPGLYILGANDLFGIHNQPKHQKLKVCVSFFEIYCGKLFDLLNSRNELKIREDNKQNVHIVGLEEHEIFTPQEFMNTITVGSGLRITSENSTNAVSSRSHAILQIILKEGKKTFGKISFIDLAGSERGADHMDQNKQTRIDGAEINKSLLALKECIRALDQGKGHTPFRGSKLTMVLKDSFVGFCKTVMIGNISPGLASCENTLNTLRYADRVKELKKSSGTGSTEPVSREDQLAKELMLPRMNKNAVRIMIEKEDDEEDIQNKKKEAHQKIMGHLGDPKPMQNNSISNFEKPTKANPVQNQPNQPNQSKKLQDPSKVKKFAVGVDEKRDEKRDQKRDEKRAESLTVKTSLNNNLFSNTRTQNFFDNSKTANPKQQNPSPPKTKANNNTAKTLSNKNNEGLPQKSAQSNPNASLQRLNNMKEKQQTPRQSSLNSKSSVFSSFSGSRHPISLNTNSNTQRFKLVKHESEEHRREADSRKKVGDTKWTEIVHGFRQWHPSGEEEMAHFKEAHEFLIGKLIEEEDQITAQHSLTINREIEVIKQEMQFISDLEKDKGKYESIEYAQFMENSIDTKLKSLLELKKRVNVFKERLLEHQECEEKIFMAKDQLGEEQLLDDLDEFEAGDAQAQN